MEEHIAGTVENGKDSFKQMESLELANQRMQKEFDGQRAVMKKLLLQKEGELSRKIDENTLLLDQLKQLKNELDDVKSQLVVDSMRESDFEEEKRKAEGEIATLQKLIHETMEESSSSRHLYDQELLKLQGFIQYLQKEIEHLKVQNTQQGASQEHSLAPSVVINALTKGLAKKLDAFGGSQEDKLERPQEDIESLRSLIEPLEDQIRALKEKLRATDEQLQKCRDGCHSSEPNRSPEKINLQSTTATNTSFDSKVQQCDMCSNYEAQLVNEQKLVEELKLKVHVAEKSAERHKEDLVKEIGFRKEMEEKWNEKREQHKQQVTELTRITNCTEQDLRELKQYFDQTSRELRTELLRLTRERDKIHQELNKLQDENDNLVGKYTLHSQQLQSEAINLPDTVEELHELVLKIHQDLIIAKVGKEAAEEKIGNLQSDVIMLKSQIEQDQHERRALEESADIEMKQLKKSIDKLVKEKKQFLAKNADVADKENRISELETLQKQLRDENHELRTRVSSLQDELENGEAVQRDFVKLSQSLQIQLEKIREADHQVRWQHDEDVDECPRCHIGLLNAKKKQHCRHCGQIFCQNCLGKIVPSGPSMRPSKVCDVCHTLLVKSSAPFFSKEPPMS